MINLLEWWIVKRCSSIKRFSETKRSDVRAGDLLWHERLPMAVKVMWYSWACLSIKNFLFQNWKITKELWKVPFNFEKELLKELRLIMTIWQIIFFKKQIIIIIIIIFYQCFLNKIGLVTLKDYKECKFEKSLEHLQQFDKYIFFKQHSFANFILFSIGL